MKHFYAFEKRKKIVMDSRTNLPGYNPAIYTPEFSYTAVMRLQAELLRHGYMFEKDTFDLLVSDGDIVSIYADLVSGLKRLFGSTGYEPIYKDFPMSVKELPYEQFVLNAVLYYWTNGNWRPEDEEYIQRELAIEPVNIRLIGHISTEDFNSIFSEIVYSGSSISAFDKEIIDWFLDYGGAEAPILSHIPFKETRAYIGKRLFESSRISDCIASATDLLRVYAAWCGGDEGLKEKTKFKQPNNVQKAAMRTVLDSAYDIEDSFKTYREEWLRVLFYLNPLAAGNKQEFPTLAKYADALRNNPKSLRTFNSRVEEAIKNKDVAIFNLLKNRSGVFMRRMNELYGIFGITAINRFIEINPGFDKLVSLYNYFSDRSESKGRAVILASANKSEVKTFDSLEAIEPEALKEIKDKIFSAINESVKHKRNGVAFIDQLLYFRPLALNNRAANLSISGNAIGTVETVPEGRTIRAYVHWSGYFDIDLSAFMILDGDEIKKIGWDGWNKDAGILYSGDNTGHANHNAEYIDITPEQLPDTCEWIVLEARVFRGPTFAQWPNNAKNGVHAGWMLREYPDKNPIWLPETVENAMSVQSKSKNTTLLAFHVKTRNVVYLDVSIGDGNIVGGSEEARQVRMFLEKFVVLDSGDSVISWDKLNQGHILELLADSVCSDQENADHVFEKETKWERVAGCMNKVSLV